MPKECSERPTLHAAATHSRIPQCSDSWQGPCKTLLARNGIAGPSRFSVVFPPPPWPCCAALATLIPGFKSRGTAHFHLHPGPPGPAGERPGSAHPSAQEANTHTHTDTHTHTPLHTHLSCVSASVNVYSTSQHVDPANIALRTVLYAVAPPQQRPGARYD